MSLDCINQDAINIFGSVFLSIAIGLTQAGLLIPVVGGVLVLLATPFAFLGGLLNPAAFAECSL